MSKPNYVHLLPERDRMMADTYRLNADGSQNATGEAVPQESPLVRRGVSAVPPEASTKKVEVGEAETKVVTPDEAANKSAKEPAKKAAAKKTSKKKG